MILNVFGVPVALAHCVVISYKVIIPLGVFGGDHERSRVARLVASTRTASGGPGSKTPNQIEDNKSLLVPTSLIGAYDK